MKAIFSKQNLGVIVLFLLGSQLVVAQSLSVEDYIQADLDVRNITLQGAKERLYLLTQGAGKPVELKSDANIQDQVNQVYQRIGLTAAGTIAWSARHREEIRAWLEENPDQQAEYDTITAGLESVSAQIQLLVE